MLKYRLSGSSVISSRATRAFLAWAAERCWQQEQAAETYGWVNRKPPQVH